MDSDRTYSCREVEINWEGVRTEQSFSFIMNWFIQRDPSFEESIERDKIKKYRKKMIEIYKFK